MEPCRKLEKDLMVVAILHATEAMYCTCTDVSVTETISAADISATLDLIFEENLSFSQ